MFTIILLTNNAKLGKKKKITTKNREMKKQIVEY